jgi:hypothetical protein
VPYQAKQGNQTSREIGGPPPKKKQRFTANTPKNFKKEFDPRPSDITLSDHPPSQKLKLFKSMIVQSWLNCHSNFQNIQPGGGWLVGFADRLERNELHETDWDHLEELTLWQQGDNGGNTSDHQPEAGPSSHTM